MKILITGGSSGLGLAMTKKLAMDDGNFIYFTYNSSIERANELMAAHSNTKAIKCDFTNESELQNLLNEIESFDLDVLINNAISSKITMKHFDKMDIDIFKNSFLHNIIPTIQITQKCVAGFKKKKQGRIITTLTSFLANKPPTGCSEYVASKAYLESLSKSWASEYIKYNISSNCISPSFMLTDFTNDTDERMIEEQTAQHPLKRLLDPAEVADTISYLTTCSLQINGINLFINAGTNLI
ncbi:MAG: SDR family oxidoreductase [Bacteroidota bacterium]